MDSLAERLRHLAFTAGLDGPQVERLAGIATEEAWYPGTTIFREGDIGSALYLIEHGRVALEVAVPGKGRVTILTVGAGDVFGWSSLFYQRPKTASARAVESTRAFAFDATKLREYCEKDSSLGYRITQRILHVVSDRLGAVRMQLLDMYGT